MTIPTSKERPDYFYWSTPKERQRTLSEDELADLIVAMANYTHQRFPIGQRFKLARDYGGIPKGTGLTVVSTWPHTMVRWDKWALSGYGAQRKKCTMSFELDCSLEVVGA